MQIQRGICWICLVLFIFNANNLSAAEESFCSRIVATFMGSSLGKQSEIDRAKRDDLFKNWTRTDFEKAIKSKYKLDADSLFFVFIESLKKYHSELSSYVEQNPNLSFPTSLDFNSQLSQLLSLIDHRFYLSSRTVGFKPSRELSIEFSVILQKVKSLLEAVQPLRPASGEPEPDLSWTSGITLEEEAHYRFRHSKWLNYYQAIAANNAGLQSIHWIQGRLRDYRHL